MKLATIEMPRMEARKAFLEYRHAVRERHNAEDEQIMRCYKALAGGHLVIDLNDVMRRAGADKAERPKLAIARADDTHICFQRELDGRLRFFPRGQRWVHGNAKDLGRRIISCSAGTLPRLETSRLNADGFAMVPNIPPSLRPAHALSNYHILWEAKWERLPPRDPALLKWLGGSLYAVLAVWDLTPVERAVLGLTRN